MNTDDFHTAYAEGCGELPRHLRDPESALELIKRRIADSELTPEQLQERFEDRLRAKQDRARKHDDYR